MANWTFDFTPEKLAQCCSRNKQPAVLFAALEAVLPKYEINNVDRVAAFLAQCGHESVDFSVLQENLNYSAKGLCATWPSRFRSEAEAMPYNRNPEAIATRSTPVAWAMVMKPAAMAGAIVVAALYNSLARAITRHLGTALDLGTI